MIVYVHVCVCVIFFFCVRMLACVCACACMHACLRVLATLYSNLNIKMINSGVGHVCCPWILYDKWESMTNCRVNWMFLMCYINIYMYVYIVYTVYHNIFKARTYLTNFQVGRSLQEYCRLTYFNYNTGFWSVMFWSSIMSL